MKDYHGYGSSVMKLLSLMNPNLDVVSLPFCWEAWNPYDNSRNSGQYWIWGNTLSLPLTGAVFVFLGTPLTLHPLITVLAQASVSRTPLYLRHS